LGFSRQEKSPSHFKGRGGEAGLRQMKKIKINCESPKSVAKLSPATRTVRPKKKSTVSRDEKTSPGRIAQIKKKPGVRI